MAVICFYVFMRTTVEISADLLKEAKARAARQGESLKSLLTRALAAELGRNVPEPADRRLRQEFPVFGNPANAGVDLTNADLAQALAEEDIILIRKTTDNAS